MTLRKLAGLLVAFGLMLGLIGAGVSAQFTDNATAQMSVRVGTFDITLSSTQGTVSCPLNTFDSCTVTYTAPEIQSSAPASAPFSFTVTSNGTIPANITVSAVVTGGGPFSDSLGAVAPFQLTNGQSHVFSGGLSWTELGMSDLGTTHSVTYTILATG
jgi:predicted ribosomally synthesized peptide with SipW-like signal peptide